MKIKTKSKMIKQIIGLFVALLTLSVSAQQEPQFTQYMYNPSQINPAYSGSAGYATSFGLYRTQWVGLDGAPKTAN
jgi:hypothetical protein